MASKQTPRPPRSPLPPKAQRQPTEAPEEGMARCGRHQEWEDAEGFARDRSSKTGLYGMCKSAEAETPAKRTRAQPPANKLPPPRRPPPRRLRRRGASLRLD